MLGKRGSTGRDYSLRGFSFGSGAGDEVVDDMVLLNDDWVYRSIERSIRSLNRIADVE